MLGRRFAGAELKSSYWETAKRRLQQPSAGTLPLRDVEEPVYDPSGVGAVARMPDHIAWNIPDLVELEA
jgi:hypothetical protein